MFSINDLLEAYEQNTFQNQMVKGLTDEQLREFVSIVIKGGTGMKACAYNALKAYTKDGFSIGPTTGRIG